MKTFCGSMALVSLLSSALAAYGNPPSPPSPPFPTTIAPYPTSIAPTESSNCQAKLLPPAKAAFSTCKSNEIIMELGLFYDRARAACNLMGDSKYPGNSTAIGRYASLYVWTGNNGTSDIWGGAGWGTPPTNTTHNSVDCANAFTSTEAYKGNVPNLCKLPFVYEKTFVKAWKWASNMTNTLYTYNPQDVNPTPQNNTGGDMNLSDWEKKMSHWAIVNGNHVNIPLTHGSAS